MHAAIRRFQITAGAVDALVRTARALTATLSEIPGFISFVMLETDDGGLTAIFIFEDRAGLEAADQATTAWAAQHSVSENRPALPLMRGQIVVQRGL
jgi:heme-degrading monooxygenase HmoA